MFSNHSAMKLEINNRNGKIPKELEIKQHTHKTIWSKKKSKGTLDNISREMKMVTQHGKTYEIQQKQC